MNFVNFETQEQFKQLQKNNVVIVKWKKRKAVQGIRRNHTS